ncbi:MAG TPA: DUF4129 domain-containing protein [Acidimicrobiales bacterium]|nr:DUF4129 domain-containing protein [Acidimicrobiales bacterium]
MKVLAHWLRRSPGWARGGFGPTVAVLVLLSLLVSLGTHVKLGKPVWYSHPRAYDAVTAGVLEAVVVVLLVAVAVRTRRAAPGGGDPVAATLRSVLRWVLGLGAVALAVTVLVLANISLPVPKLRAPTTPTRSLSTTGRLAPRAAGAPGNGSHVGVTGLLYGVIVALVVLAFVIVVLVARRQRQGDALPEPTAPAEDYAITAQEAISGGRRALVRLDDAREAIIACYVSMEASLAAAGAERSVAETPDELLAKAVRLSLVGGSAAGRLTSLFYEARFSTHHMGRSQRDAAERALAQLEADLGHRSAMAPGA